MKAFILAVFLLGGCASGAKATVEKMRSAACSGDSASFFALVDRNAVVESVARAAAAKTGKGAGKLAELAARKAATDALQAWEDDMKKGRDGDLCRMSLGDETPNGGETNVEVSTPTGRRRVWVFKAFDRRWLLVAIRDP